MIIMSNLNVIEWSKNVPMLIVVNTDTRLIVDRCNVGATCAFTPDDEFLPSCGRCGEALRPSQDLAEVISSNDVRLIVHAEPCAQEIVLFGGSIA